MIEMLGGVQEHFCRIAALTVQLRDEFEDGRIGDLLAPVRLQTLLGRAEKHHILGRGFRIEDRQIARQHQHLLPRKGGIVLDDLIDMKLRRAEAALGGELGIREMAVDDDLRLLEFIRQRVTSQHVAAQAARGRRGSIQYPCAGEQQSELSHREDSVPKDFRLQISDPRLQFERVSPDLQSALLISSGAPWRGSFPVPGVRGCR